MTPSRPRSGSAFSLIELLVVIAIIALLIGIALPVLASVRTTARETVCLSKSRQIALALATFATDNNGRYPENRTAVSETEHVTWRYQFSQAGFDDPDNWACPAHPGDPLSELDQFDRDTRCVGDVPSSYALNGHLLWREETRDAEAIVPDARIQRPSHTILVAETRARYPDLRATDQLIAADYPGGGGAFGYWHRGDGVYSFQDGHAETLNLFETGSPDCRWHNGRDLEADTYDPQAPAETTLVHDHPDWEYLASEAYFKSRP